MKEEFEQDVVHSVASQGETMSAVRRDHGIGNGERHNYPTAYT